MVTPAGSNDPALNPGRSDPESYYPGGAGRPHPGPSAVVLPRAIRDALIAHARAEAPNEACGIIVGDRPAGDGGRALRWVPLRNPLASPYRYAIDPDDLLRLTIETDQIPRQSRGRRRRCELLCVSHGARQ